MIGLGRMGSNMSQRLLQKGHRVVVYDRKAEAAEALRELGGTPAYDLQQLIGQLRPPRAVWLMVPAGGPVGDTIESLVPFMEPDDVLIDGGNSYYKDSMAAGEHLREKGLRFLDVGTSGGVWGLKEGYCLMIGGEEEVFRRLEPVFQALAPIDGYAHVGPNGAGHFVKMVHNGIEYGMLQAYAEGFELLEAAQFDLDLPQVAELWRHGSVVRSWLLDLAQTALRNDPKLQDIRGYVEDSGEGRWTVMEAIERDVPAMTLALSLFVRFRSRQTDSFGAKLIAALRQEFGGHRVLKE